MVIRSKLFYQYFDRAPALQSHFLPCNELSECPTRPCVGLFVLVRDGGLPSVSCAAYHLPVVTYMVPKYLASRRDLHP
jgi:hypothetical protein